MTDAATTELVSLTLDSPVIRGDQEIATIQLRKPKAGELRGLSLGQLGQMNVDEVRKLLPRITVPPLTIHEVDQLEPADLMEFADKIMDFLLSKARKAALPTM